MSAEKNTPSYACEVCHVVCPSAVNLSDHIEGVKHRYAMRRESLEFLENLKCLQYFIDTFMKEEPMIGLEYIVEFLKNGFYTYKCLLCDTETPRKSTILHIGGARHIKAYLVKHHPELLLNRDYCHKKEYKQQMKTIALEAQRIYGRKSIVQDYDHEQNEKDARLNPTEAPKISSTVTPEVLPSLKGESQQIPSGHTSIKSIIVETEKLNQLKDFKTNDDFLNYLQNFEIQNDDDASFIQQIIKKCSEALMKYREDQTKTQVSSTLPSNSDPKSNKNPSDKANLSSKKLHKECHTSAEIPPIFQNKSEVFDSFFKSIKHMDVSEVTVILKRITASNPAFREINIPGLIKYLQDTGKLNS